MLSYLDFINEETLDEASLGRFIQHMDNGDPFAIISACRYGMSMGQKKSVTDKLRSEVLSAGFGFHKCVGGYVETQENGETREITDELSSIVYGTKETEKKLRTFAFELGIKYKQDSILWCGSDGKAMWRYTNNSQDFKGNFMRRGDYMPLGDFVPTRIGDYFSKIGKKHFTFKSID